MRHRLTHSEIALFKSITERNTRKFMQVYLTSEYVDKKAVNDNGETLLNAAIRNNAVDIAVLLSKDPELINHPDNNGHPPAVCFKRHINEALLVELINNGMDINQRSVIMTGDKKGQECGTLLHRIALFGTKDDFEIAKKHGASLNIRNFNAERPKDVLRRLDRTSEFTI